MAARWEMAAWPPLQVRWARQHMERRQRALEEEGGEGGGGGGLGAVPSRLPPGVRGISARDSVSIGSPKPRRHSRSSLEQSGLEQSDGVERGAEGPPPEWGLAVPWPWHAPTVFAVDAGGRETARGGGAARRWDAARCEVDPVQLFQQLDPRGGALELAASGGGGPGGDGMITRADFVSFGADLLQVCGMCMARHVHGMCVVLSA